MSILPPLADLQLSFKNAESCVLVIFGATGDLTARKLVPALYHLAKDGQLPGHFACVGFARRHKDHQQFREEMRVAVTRFSHSQPIDETVWAALSAKFFYLSSEFDEEGGYERLKDLLHSLDIQCGTKGNRLFYLSVPPSYFPSIIQHLSQHGLIYSSEMAHKWSRVIIEKPFGEDEASARALQEKLTHYLDEEQIFRIDHYLGKETVQNLLAFRFGNAIFESVWNNRYVNHVQITVAEDLGIGTRGRFWEEAGMLRDIVQNHMMQLLTLVAMEPPIDLRPSSIHNEKVKVLESIRPFSLDTLSRHAVRGQYGPGLVNGEKVRGYREEENVSPVSSVETYVALRLSLDSWRWSGVPFYLRAGKRLPKKSTEISITFRTPPGFLFQASNATVTPNVLIMRIQPDEGICLTMNCKVPGLSQVIHPVNMEFRYRAHFGTSPPEAYERLICDAMAGDHTLFARDDEVVLSWQLLTPLLHYWQNTPCHFPNYAAGTWGPAEADELLQQEGHAWRLM